MRKNMAALCMALCLLLCLALAGTAFAESAENSARVPVIRDDADLLSDAEEEALRQEMLPICEYGTPMFWTTTEAGDYEALAERFFHSRLSLRESGVLFVINMRARQLTIFSDGAIYRAVTDADAVTITDNVFRMAGREEYYACASSAFSQIQKLLRGEQIARPMKIVSNVMIALVLALLGVYLYIGLRYESRGTSGKGKAALPVTAAAAAAVAVTTANRKARMTKQKKIDISSSFGGGGGHSGGGGGGGGGSSGGGGSHGF